MAKDSPQHPTHIKHLPVRLPYVWNAGGGGGKEATPNVTRVRSIHGAKLLRQMRETQEAAEEKDFAKLGEDYLADKGNLLTFILNPTFKNKLDTFDSITAGVELLSLQTAQDIRLGEVLIANVFVSHGQLKYFISKLEVYAHKNKNLPFADQIERIGEATIKALWTSMAPLPETGKDVWWEVWLRRGRSDQSRFVTIQHQHLVISKLRTTTGSVFHGLAIKENPRILLSASSLPDVSH